MDAAAEIVQPEISRVLAALFQALRSATVPYEKLEAVTEAAAALEPFDDTEAIGRLSQQAIDVHDLHPDDVQIAITQGLQRGAARAYHDNRPRQEHSSTNGVGRKRRDTGPATARGFDWRNNRVSAKDIRSMTFNPITFLARDIIPNEGITLICAKPKVGKSWLVLDIAIGATADRYVLGDIKPVQGDVLYLALEDSNRRLQSRMMKLLPSFAGEWPEGLTFATQWRRVDQGGLDDIREWAAETKAKGRTIAFISIDVLKMVRPPSKAGQPAYEADYEAIKGLHQLAIELGAPIIVIHHTRKADADDLMDKVSGTAGLTGAVDTIIIIERQSQGTVLDVRGRDIEANTLAIEFNKDTCRWTILGTADVVQRTSERRRIMAIFEKANRPLTLADVTSELDCDTSGCPMSQPAIRKIVSRMAKNGDLIRLDRGLYSLPTGVCHRGTTSQQRMSCDL